jgi:hypothetical protein
MGMYRRQLDGLIKQAQSTIVSDEMKGIMNNAELDASSKRDYLKDLQSKYPEYIAQDPSLKKDIDNQLTTLDFNIVYQEPFVDKFTNNLTQSLGVAKKEKNNKSFKIRNDGYINLYNNDGKQVGFVDFENNPSMVNYKDVIEYIKNNTSIETVRKSMGGNLTNGQLAFVFKSSPIYKTLQKATMGNMTKKYPEIFNELADIYDSWENLR